MARKQRTTAWLFCGYTLLALVLAPPSFASIESWFAPRKNPWPRWSSHDDTSTERIDHGPWQRLLDIYVVPDRSGVNRFAYAKVTAADRDALAGYIAVLASIPIAHHNRDEQFAYWVNLYNALTIKTVLDHYPVRSIRDIDISPGLFESGPWDKPLVAVDGQMITLNDIEHRILRPIWDDPRIHYAVNCASIGCPNLQKTAFTGANRNMLLDAAAREYVNSPRGAQVRNGHLAVSRIYDWYQEDFGGNGSAALDHLRRYAEPPLAAALAGVRAIDDFQYDWLLNDAATAP